MTAAGPRVVVLDHGSGNLRSAVRALARAGAEVELTADPGRAESADALVVPGVGAFAACMAGLRRIGAVDLVRTWVADQRPVLGICVGFQVLFESGAEHGRTTAGCGVLTGQVTRLEAPRLPHMGWNTVEVSPGSRYFPPADSAAPTDRYYFVHSYGVRNPAELPQMHAGNRSPAGIWGSSAEIRLVGGGDPVLVHTTEHQGARFVAAVEAGPLLATQFHPEKSAATGSALLRRWVSRVRNR